MIPACDSRASDCRCAEPIGHDGIHHCECGGSWEYVGGVFTPRSLPGVDQEGLLGDIARGLQDLLGSSS